MVIHLDYTLKTPEERIALVNKILEQTSPQDLRPNYINYLSDYILFVADKGQTTKERKEEYPIVTENRKVTINKRQTSYEGMVETLENGEDGIHALMNDSKVQLLDNRDRVTEEELEKFPQLREQVNIIETLKSHMKNATGQKRYQLKKQIIEQWQQLYSIRASLKNTSFKSANPSRQVKSMARMSIPEQITINKETGAIKIDSPLSLLKPEHVSIILSYYSELKQECQDDLHGDMHWLLIDLENAITYALRHNKTSVRSDVLLDLIIWKIDGETNEEIQRRMNAKYGIVHTAQYYSNL